GMAAALWSMLQSVQDVHGGDYPSFFWNVRAPFHHSVLGILAGVMVALAHGSQAARASAMRRGRFGATGGVLLPGLCMRDWVKVGDWTAVCLVIASCTALSGLLVWTGLAINARKPGFGDLLPLRAIARLSYALYLTHFAMIEPAQSISTSVASFSAA